MEIDLLDLKFVSARIGQTWQVLNDKATLTSEAKTRTRNSVVQTNNLKFDEISKLSQEVKVDKLN